MDNRGLLSFRHAGIAAFWWQNLFQSLGKHFKMIKYGTLTETRGYDQIIVGETYEFLKA